MGDRNLWKSGLPKFPTWKQKAKKHPGKRFGSKLAPGAEKKRKIGEIQVPNSSEWRFRFLSNSEVSDPARRAVCVSANEERDDVRVWSDFVCIGACLHRGDSESSHTV